MRVAAAVVAVLALVVVGHFVRLHLAGRLLLPGEVASGQLLGSFGTVRAPAGAFTIGDLVVCTDGHPVTVTDVRLVEPKGGLRVTRWAVRPSPGDTAGKLLASNRPGTLEQDGVASGAIAGPKGLLVDRACPRRHSELVVQLSKPSAADAETEGFDVAYRAGLGVTGTLRIGLRVSLCREPLMGMHCQSFLQSDGSSTR